MFLENWIDSRTENALPTPSQSGQWLPHARSLKEELVRPRMQSRQLTGVVQVMIGRSCKTYMGYCCSVVWQSVTPEY